MFFAENYKDQRNSGNFCVDVRCGSPFLLSIVLVRLVVRTSGWITEDRGFIPHLEVGFFSSVQLMLFLFFNIPYITLVEGSLILQFV